jgi:hypothetical protein
MHGVMIRIPTKNMKPTGILYLVFRNDFNSVSREIARLYAVMITRNEYSYDN